MKTKAVKGTNDYLPKEMEIREYMQKVIVEEYKKNGFSTIYTPILEDIENLNKSDGGENLNLIFNILKRGEKLENAIQNNDFKNLADLGLRYDLTLPLTRFYAEHKNDLPSVFKVIQMGNVYRAERPQKGRNREFMQCDIDIIGDKSERAEIELIDTTARALLKLNILDFVIKINDRKLLKSVLCKLGFREDEFDSVCISFDKLDKIGINGIKEELLSKNMDENVINKFCDFILKDNDLKSIEEFLGESEEIRRLKNIICTIDKIKENYNIQFDLSLVRGQGYYTGTVFEIKSDEFSCSIGGGGRYDNLIKKFTGEDKCAVGFSIGFERIFAMLKEKNITLNARKKIAIIYNENDFLEGIKVAHMFQNEFDTFLSIMPKKLGKFLGDLEKEGYFGYFIVNVDKEIKKLKGIEK